MNGLVTETQTRILIVCDNCCESLSRHINHSGKTIEIRVKTCSDCLSKAKEIIKGLLNCPDLNFDNLEKESINQINKALKWMSD